MPYWNEQVRFKINMPHFGMFYFVIKNHNEPVAYGLVPARAVQGGIRFINLYNMEHKKIKNGKLYVDIHAKLLIKYWVPE